MNPSEEIKSKLDIVEGIREYIQLKSTGANFQALCPFHREKSSSFVVSPDKQIWHCFGCGKGGDIITFVMEMEGVSFVEALRMLAPKAGVTLKKEDSQATSQRNRLLDIMEIATNYYHKNLLESQEAEPARQYLAKRGLTQETIKEWQIGYSPESWNDIIDLLKKRGYGEREVYQAGLCTKKEHQNHYYNRFRGRIMFPINEFNGNTVAFSARVRPDKEEQEKMGKYINSPQTLVYDKSRILFGLDKAKMTIRNAKFALVAEGQMDVISAHQHGFKNVIASSGTALTETQLQILKRYTNNLALAFDMDEAGRMAADRGIQEALKQDMNVKVVTLPGGKDPDELIRSNPQEFQAAIENASHIMDYYFQMLLSELDLGSVEGKREAAKRMLPIIAKIDNKIEKDEWLRRLSETINTDERYLREALPKEKKQQKREGDEEEEGQSFSQKSRGEVMSETLLALLLRYPSFLELTVNRLDVDEVFGYQNKMFYKNLVIYYNKANSENALAEMDFDSFKEQLSSSLEKEGEGEQEQLRLLDKLGILGEKEFNNLEPDQAKKELLKTIQELKRLYISERKKEIEQLIAQSEREGNKERVEELMRELKTLSEEYGLTE